MTTTMQDESHPLFIRKIYDHGSFFFVHNYVHVVYYPARMHSMGKVIGRVRLLSLLSSLP